MLINFTVGIGLLLMTLALTGCLVESEKAVLPMQYSTDLGLQLGDYSNCLAEKDYANLAKTNDCNSLRLIRVKSGELVAINNNKGYYLISLKNIEGNLYLFQLEVINGLSEDLNIIGVTAQDSESNLAQPKKIFYGFVRHNKDENIWQYFLPDGRSFDENLKTELRKVTQFKFGVDGSLNIKKPSIENLSRIMKLLSNNQNISFAVVGRISQKNK